MNRWILPGAVIGVVTGATVVATLVGAQTVPVPPVAGAEATVSVVCPGFESVTASVRIAVAGIGGSLSTAEVDDPVAASGAGNLRIIEDPGASLRVSAPLPGPFGGVSSVLSEAGPERGLSGVGCTAPSTRHWFTGTDVRDIAQSEVVVANLDDASASVDLTVYGEDGQLTAPRGIEVEGHSVRTISFGTIERSAGPVTVEVSSGDGRIAAFVRQRTWQLDEALGADWLPEATAPATELVVPGVPSGSGTRRLAVTNPGERTATVSIATLTGTGPGEPVGAGKLEVPPQTTRSIDLRFGLDDQSAALSLTSTDPVTAGVWLDAGGNNARRDPAYTAATEPLPADSLWPVSFGKDASTVLQLANPGTSEATATLTAGTLADPGTAEQVTVPAGSMVEVPLVAGAANLVRVETPATDLRGALVSTSRLGKVRALAVVDLAGEARSAQPTVVFDPHTGG